MKKRLFSLLLAGMLVVGLVAGCGKKEESGEAKSGGDEGSEKLKVALVVNQKLIDQPAGTTSLCANRQSVFRGGSWLLLCHKVLLEIFCKASVSAEKGM